MRQLQNESCKPSQILSHRSKRRTGKVTASTTCLSGALLSSLVYWQPCYAFQTPFARVCRPMTAPYYSRIHSNNIRPSPSSITSSSTSLGLIPPHDPSLLFHDGGGALHSVTQLISSSIKGFVETFEVPFAEMGKELSQSLDIGSSLSQEVERIPETTTGIVLESLGYDLLVFLAAAVVVTPLSKALNITPILGYLILGAILGPHALDLFANSKADVELGDFGILFLLFSEGLEVTSSRLKQLTHFLPLGFAQISLATAAITAVLLSDIPQFLAHILPLDPAVSNPSSPVQAVILAMIGSLSTSAFIFPVLKERGWEEGQTGEAATSILLLQDLMVAPLLVLLPYLIGESPTDYAAIGFLTAKATLGFGAIMYVASFALREVFRKVTQTESAETFVALCLLVAAGMGTIAKMFGLTDTAGAFAAGVLLANTNYRAQIQADILPFKGILLGIFFMEAGSQFDIDLVLLEWPTILVGSIGLLLIKALVVALAASDRSPIGSGMTKPNTVRLSLLLAGGGEFAFVVLALAEKLGGIPRDLGAVVTAIVLITMGVTPLLGEMGNALSQRFVDEVDVNGVVDAEEDVLVHVDSNSVVVCGYGEIGRSVLRELGSARTALMESRPFRSRVPPYPRVVAFDTDPTVTSAVCPTSQTCILYGDGSNPQVIRSSGVLKPSAIFVSYEEHNRVLSATARLRAAFPDVPIYTRAATRAEVPFLVTAGATEVVVESDELPRAASQLVRGVWGGNLEEHNFEEENLRAAAATAAGVSRAEAEVLLELFAGMDTKASGGVVSVQEIESILERSSNWIATDDDIQQLDDWVEHTLKNNEVVDAIEFCRLYSRAPDAVKRAFGLSRDKVKEPR